MRTNAPIRGIPHRHEISGIPAQMVVGLLEVVRFVAFAVLSALEPFVRAVLLLLGLAGLAACVVYRGLLHDPRFPLGTMMMLSVGFCVAAAAYGVLVQWLSGEAN
jgi:hypothetical protein